ncbi:MAG TPA: hypothetical protein VFG25_00155 [Nitrosopumilaceae archaeon]|nr:hypothetical protein [Nitrosopumilaceae archaeon]
MLKKRRGDVGPSGVIVVIMAMVGSVVLASGVVLYGTSLFQGGSQQESISVTGMKLWVHGTSADGLAWGAFAVRNTGDKVLSVDKISVRGTDVPFTQWYPDTTVTSSIIQQPMNFTGWSGVNGMLNTNSGDSCPGGDALQVNIQNGVSVDDSDVCVTTAAAGPVGLDPGSAAIIYFKLNNGTVTTVDGGASTSVSVFAGKVGAPQSIPISSKV